MLIASQNPFVDVHHSIKIINFEGNSEVKMTKKMKKRKKKKKKVMMMMMMMKMKNKKMRMKNKKMKKKKNKNKKMMDCFRIAGCHNKQLANFRLSREHSQV